MFLSLIINSWLMTGFCDLHWQPGTCALLRIHSAPRSWWGLQAAQFSRGDEWKPFSFDFFCPALCSALRTKDNVDRIIRIYWVDSFNNWVLSFLRLDITAISAAAAGRNWAGRLAYLPIFWQLFLCCELNVATTVIGLCALWSTLRNKSMKSWRRGGSQENYEWKGKMKWWRHRKLKST